MPDGFQIVPESWEDCDRESRMCLETARRFRKTAAGLRAVIRRMETEPGYKPPWFTPGGGGKRNVRYEQET